MSFVSDAFSKRDKKAEQRADDIARQTLTRSQEIADQARQGILQATALTPEESALRAKTLGTVQGRLGLPGETLFQQQGPVSTETAAQILQRIQNPGMDFQSTTAEETRRALEEGVFPTFAARGISPTSPLVVEEGRREARDVAIRNAALKLATIQSDLGRGQEFSTQAGGLEELARRAGIDISETARTRQAAGGTAASELAAQLQQQGSLAQSSIQSEDQKRAAELSALINAERRPMLQDIGGAGLKALGPILGMIIGGPAGAAIGSTLSGIGGTVGSAGKKDNTSLAFQTFLQKLAAGGK